ncbi:MAG: hypothetical protein IPJ81_16050 [Chitinophagaceae bacterium]|nr:hypothetical protein [Chitinophagaceae bacterium]
MDCLIDYIGVKGCGNVKPLSGMYINQLAGISLESMERIADKEQVTFMGVWKDVQARAWLRLEKDLRRSLRKRYQLKSVSGNGYINPDIDTVNTEAASPHYKGVVIDINSSIYNKQKHSFLSIGISDIKLTLPQPAASVKIKIFDEAGNELDEFTIANAIAGVNTIEVAQKYPAQRLFIALDASALPLATGSIPKDVISGCYDCICKVCGDNCQASIYGAHSLIDTPSAISKEDNFYGMQICFSVCCDYNTLICCNKQEFIDVWLFLLGCELMLERLYSPRLNKYTTIDKEDPNELKDYYTAEYEKALEETILGISVDQEDCCIVCDPKIRYRENLP